MSSTGQAFPQARILSNGDLHFPHRGDPPKEISGFLKDKGDPYLFHTVLKPCKVRNVCWVKVCGGMIQRTRCEKFNIKVTLTDCLACTVREV